VSRRKHKAVERSLRERAEIRRIWLELIRRAPFEQHTARAIGRRLSFNLTDDAVRWHMRAIRAAAAVELVSGPDVFAPPECAA
jgi:hypothetical protein